MDFWEKATVAVSVVTLAASGVMAWRAIRRQRQVPDAEKPRQFRRFTRRRLLMSALVAVAGLALLLGSTVFHGWLIDHPRDFTVFWIGVILLLFVLLGLAVADVYAVLHAQISAHYSSENWEATKTQRGEEEEKK